MRAFVTENVVERDRGIIDPSIGRVNLGILEYDSIKTVTNKPHVILYEGDTHYYLALISRSFIEMCYEKEGFD